MSRLIAFNSEGSTG